MGKIVLIGGSSHCGKSSLAAELGAQLSADVVSTDSLARHPGRPWREKLELIPLHVREHYATLSVNELIEDVLVHCKVSMFNIHYIGAFEPI